MGTRNLNPPPPNEVSVNISVERASLTKYPIRTVSLPLHFSPYNYHTHALTHTELQEEPSIDKDTENLTVCN